MTPPSRSGLARLLHTLGSTLLNRALGDVDPQAEVSGVVIHDPADEPVFPPRAIVLGVGTREPEHITELLRALQRSGSAALVVREPIAVTPELTAAVADTGVALLGLVRGASWTQLTAMLRSILAEGDVGDTPPLGGIPSGDLFSLSNAIAALIDAPVTIEDCSCRVMAFSGRQDEADSSRVETILGRQVPQQYARRLSERGVFRDLYRSDRPMYLEPPALALKGISVPRVAIAVRAGDELLGSIWAAVRAPLSSDRMQALTDAAPLVALHLLRVRAGADVQRRLRTQLVSTALEGGSGAHEALRRLRLYDQRVVVLALALPYTRHDTAAETAADAETQWQRISDGFALHLSTVHPLCATAMIGDTTYGLVPLRHNDEEDDGQSGARTAGDFLERAGDRVRAVVSVGPVCHDVPGLVRARADADRALHVLRTRSGGARVARLPDVHAGALILELKGLMAARGEELAGPVTRLRDYDAHHGTELTQTLQAWLDTLGDITAASSALYVHPNTFRYRLRRVSEVGAMDLHDPEVRFAVMLQLRIGPSVDGHRTRSTAPAGHDRPPRSRPRSEQPGSS